MSEVMNPPCFGKWYPAPALVAERECDTCPVSLICAESTTARSLDRTTAATTRDVKVSGGIPLGKTQVGGDHYRKMDIDPWAVWDTWPLEQRIGAYRANAIKYLMRMGTKDEQIQEAKKCLHYVTKLIEVLENENQG